MPTYVENVKGGESVIVCVDCAAPVTAELQHERGHREGKWG